jgi:hypothetical protein
MLDRLHGFLHLLLDPLLALLASMGLGFMELATILILLLVVTGACWINIFAKAGFRSSMGYLMLIPAVNIFVFMRFAFGKWPIEQQLERQHTASVATKRAPSWE